MPRFERSRERKSSGSRDRGSSKGRFKGKGRRDSDRESSRFSRDRRDVEMTEVTCSSCGARCEVPFRPTSNKPVYCNDCFAKKGRGSSHRSFERSSDKNYDNRLSDQDLDVINEKLNKIMKALKIE